KTCKEHQQSNSKPHNHRLRKQTLSGNANMQRLPRKSQYPLDSFLCVQNSGVYMKHSNYLRISCFESLIENAECILFNGGRERGKWVSSSWFGGVKCRNKSSNAIYC